MLVWGKRGKREEMERTSGLCFSFLPPSQVPKLIAKPLAQYQRLTEQGAEGVFVQTMGSCRVNMSRSLALWAMGPGHWHLLRSLAGGGGEAELRSYPIGIAVSDIARRCLSK